MEKNGRITEKKIGGIAFLALILLAVICGWKDEEKRVAAEQEATEKQADVTVEQQADVSGEKEQEEADLYWEWAEKWISDMLLENESIGLADTPRKGYELFSDEWYAHSGRLTEPYLYLFICAWRDGDIVAPDESYEVDRTYLSVLYPHRAGDHPGYFLFSVWVKETDHGVELGTDFHQKLFQQVLYECSDKNAWMAGISPSEQWMWYIPLYNLLGEPVVMVSLTGDEHLEPVFREACERMHARQEQITGELEQDVRFGAVFRSEDFLRRYAVPEDEKLDIAYLGRAEYMDRKETYDAYSGECWERSAYLEWLEEYWNYYPLYHLDFHTGYDAVKQEIFQDMCACRAAYLETLGEEGEAAEEGRQEGTPQPQTWEVETGDTLWRIAESRYGDGCLWEQIYERNRDVIGADGNLIMPGQILEMP